MALLAWPLFAFGGVYGWAAVPFVLGSAGLALAARPSIGLDRDRQLDRWLLAVLAAATLQIVPIPTALVGLLSQATLHAQSLLRLSVPGNAEPARAALLTLDATDSIHALGVTAAAFLLFWTCRTVFHTGGLRMTVRAVALLGVVVSVVALAQSTRPGDPVYGWWSPIDEGAPPFGPFINRNHFGTWVVMAIPLCLGYLTARADTSTKRPRAMAAHIVRMADGRTIWLLVALAVMNLALFVSLSRSALVGAAASLALGWSFVQTHLSVRRRRWIIAGLTVAAFAAILWSDLPALFIRLGRSGVSQADRLTIWRETLPIIRDFWPFGSGVGTYETVMLLYQQSDRTVYFNQAHNHYLQIATEGGVLLGIPVVLALRAFVGVCRRRMAADRTGVYWLRAGAATGLVAVAVQSVWEIGLTMPANAALAAVLAAVVTHQPVGATQERKG